MTSGGHLVILNGKVHNPDDRHSPKKNNSKLGHLMSRLTIGMYAYLGAKIQRKSDLKTLIRTLIRPVIGGALVTKELLGNNRG